MNKGYWNAIVLALFGGAFGIQEYYLGRVALGIIATLFCWTGIPALVAWVEAMVWAFDGKEEFDKKHNKKERTVL